MQKPSSHGRSCILPSATAQNGVEVKGLTLGVAYPHVNIWDVAGLEKLAWAIYDGVYILGRVPALSGYRDWDRIVVGTPIPLIYQGEMVWHHCGPTTIAGDNVQKATKLMKEQGLLQYKERRVLITSLEVHVTLSDVTLSPCQISQLEGLLLLSLR